jgi:hypothetical protein
VSAVETRVARARVLRRPRFVLAALAIAVAAVATSCTTHHEALTNPCPTVLGRGAIAMEKLGLTPAELKLQQKC